MHLQRARDVPGLGAVAVEAQGDEVGGGELDGIPFQDDGGLGGVAAAEDGNGGGRGAEGGEDAVLEGAEVGFCFGFFVEILRNGDVDNGAGRDIWGEEDGRKLDLKAVVSLDFPWDVVQGRVMVRAYEALVWGEKDGDTCVDLADGERDEHAGD